MSHPRPILAGGACSRAATLLAVLLSNACGREDEARVARVEHLQRERRSPRSQKGCPHGAGDVEWPIWASCAPRPARTAPCPAQQSMPDRCVRAPCERRCVHSRAAGARPIARCTSCPAEPQTANDGTTFARRPKLPGARRRCPAPRNRPSGRRSAGGMATRSFARKRLSEHARACHGAATRRAMDTVA